MTDSNYIFTTYAYKPINLRRTQEKGYLALAAQRENVQNAVALEHLRHRLNGHIRAQRIDGTTKTGHYNHPIGAYPTFVQKYVDLA
jgi:hypothetical protein